MRDYSNYYPSSKIIKKNNVNLLFHNMVEQSEDGCKPIINGKEIPCLIQQHTNPLDEYKEDRKLITLSDTLNKGDIIENYVNDTWMIITDVDLDCYYYTCKIRKCNNILKWKDRFNIYGYPCIVTQDTFYNTGILQTKPMILGDGKLTAWIPKNKKTMQINRDMRFIFNKYVYKVTYVDAVSLANKENGLIILIMEETDEMVGDDFVNQIAMNKNIQQNTPEPKEDKEIDNKDNEIHIGDTTYEFTSDFEYSPFIVPKSMGQTITLHKYVDKKEVDGKFEFILDLNGVRDKDIEYKSINNNQFYIKNLEIKQKIKIKLIAKDIQNEKIIEKEIVLKGLF